MPTALDMELYDTAQLACDYAFANATDDLKSLKGGRVCFYPVVNNGFEGYNIGVGVNPDYHYLVYLNRGFASFTMKECLGKVIPIYTNGRLIFRKCTGLNRWRSGNRDYWIRTSDGELISEYRQRRAWVHPGVGPKHFIDDAIEQAVADKAADIAEAAFYDKYEDLTNEWEL